MRMHGDKGESHMCKAKKILLIILLLPVIAFLVTFGIYFFNLDMKIVAYLVDPILQKHYTKIKRKQYV